MKKAVFYSILVFYLFLLWYSCVYLGFSIVDVKGIERFRFLEIFFHYLFSIDKNDCLLRLPGVTLSLINIALFYKLSGFYLKKEKDKLFAVLIFAFLPANIISAVVINKAVYIIFLTLLFIYLHYKNRYVSFIYLSFLVFIDYSFISLFFGLIFYAIYKKDNLLLILSLIFLALNANYFHYDIGGKPSGHFLDVFGIYFLIFSPFVFIYFLYALYKGVLDKKKDVMFFISFYAFLISILLSFRQHIRIEDYAPFSVFYVMYMVRYYLHSYRVRLKPFRKFYKLLFAVLLGSLLIFDVLLFVNTHTPAKKLTENYYVIKPMIKLLRKEKIDNLYSNNRYLMEVLKFYGFKEGKSFYIDYNKKNISILHKNRIILRIDVSKLNTI